MGINASIDADSLTFQEFVSDFSDQQLLDLIPANKLTTTECAELVRRFRNTPDDEAISIIDSIFEGTYQKDPLTEDLSKDNTDHKKLLDTCLQWMYFQFTWKCIDPSSSYWRDEDDWAYT